TFSPSPPTSIILRDRETWNSPSSTVLLKRVDNDSVTRARKIGSAREMTIATAIRSRRTTAPSPAIQRQTGRLVEFRDGVCMFCCTQIIRSSLLWLSLCDLREVPRTKWGPLNGGASRDRTDDLIVAKAGSDSVTRCETITYRFPRFRSVPIHRVTVHAAVV